jgi:toxin ParE1/3/4
VNYALHPAAEEDLIEAAEFYRARGGAALVQLFFDEFERAMALLLRHPGLGAPWRSGRRRLVLDTFPYSIIYAMADGRARVYAIAHHSRRPDYWRKRSWPAMPASNS